MFILTYRRTISRSAQFALRRADRAESTDVPSANDCPHCAARDSVRLESGQYFCPWCLNTWTISGDLILDQQPGRAQDFLEELARAYEQD